MPSLNGHTDGQAGQATGKAYWRGLDAGAAPADVQAAVPGDGTGGVDRRTFMKLMGASAALAGLTACRFPRETIAPYAAGNDQTPGMPCSYATAMELGGVGAGLLVTSYDGRPTKVEGNPSDPIAAGSSSALAQGDILSLYDPERSRSVLRRDGGTQAVSSWGAFDAAMKARLTELDGTGGAGFAVLAEATSSVVANRLREQLQRRFPQMSWVEYEAVSRDNEREGARMAFGRPLRPHYHLGRARTIVTLDGDLFGTHPASAKHIRDFGKTRRTKPDGTRVDAVGNVVHDGHGHTVKGMSRLYAVESAWTLCGASADHRFPIRSGEIPAFVHALAVELMGGDGTQSISSGLRNALTGTTAGDPTGAAGAIAADLLATIRQHPGEALVVAGPSLPPAVHAAVNLINHALGATGASLSFTAPAADMADRPTHAAALAALTDEMGKGTINTLLILGGNPAYCAPSDVPFSDQLAKVGTVVHCGLWNDETAATAHWHVPVSHWLESWGDCRAWDGTQLLRQPLIAPLYNTRSAVELLARFAGSDTVEGRALLRAAVAGDDHAHGRDTHFLAQLQQGVVPGSADSPVQAGLQINDGQALVDALKADGQGTELCFLVDSRMWDGRFANNGWLQEVPDFITTLAWDNALLIGPRLHKSLGVKSEDRVRLTVGDKSLELPVWVVPGQANDSVALWIGYGRTAAGNVGTGTGFDANALRTTATPWRVGNVTIEKIGGSYPLAASQDHFLMDGVGARGMAQRLGKIVREDTAAAYAADPGFAHKRDHAPHTRQLFESHDYSKGHQWGMTIDLTACTGCNACVVACNAENNIPVVGKAELRYGREMHWLRIDRYFAGDPEKPQLMHQPVACVQCENAPCEQVCPVAATVHDKEGLNNMVYNRCIGTRYCSNNCPFKVRRFNFFYNHRNLAEVQEMRFNPDVTVRTRGVMEKCTFCTQRIQAAKITNRTSGRVDAGGRAVIADGEIVTACQQACPAQAIVFGDLNDPHSAVSRLMHANPTGEADRQPSDRTLSDRAYTPLEGLLLRPRLRYLARITNPNPALQPAGTDPAAASH